MNFLLLFILTFGFFFVELFASDSKIKLIPKQKTAKVLKSVAYATIRSTVMATYSRLEEKETTYNACSDEFPSMPGDFPCNLLDFSGTTDQVNVQTEISDGEFAEGRDPEDMNPSGKIRIKVSKEKSRNLNGNVILIGEGENQLSLFYSPKGQISHYHFQNTIVIFVWNHNEDQPQLSSLYFVKVGGDYFPEEVKEYSF
ncbi:MAG: LIC_11883 family protein [Leptospira bouyouniensis]|uniref:Uncharacterized protein n=1 Tax=Leptospira bouyouniensis TaxID=2484911 RepID=A0A7I0HMX5_9LEPT|nr:hypothetical protein [Leptospira bouyouniensis]TGK48689.1 hypothetical protein EHQ10_13370 [Leptospira bouyouniensis]TGL02223.1 hypothetical protein EHQ43_17850 [Leptospira bouyouniensis]TGM81060.1 hypothetical protein EHQ99_15635 [Leptospira bouyouniensis]